LPVLLPGPLAALRQCLSRVGAGGFLIAGSGGL